MAGKRQTKKTAARKTAEKQKTQTPKASVQRRPIRREVGAFVCLFLAIFCVLGCFGVDAIFISLITKFFRGLIGSGFYILPFAFLMSFIILLLHDGRPVALRVVCTFVVAAAIGSLVQLFTIVTDDLLGIKALWTGGMTSSCGGVIAGGIAELLAKVISRFGAGLVLFLVFILSLLTSLNMTIPGIIKAIRERPRAEYEAPQKEHPDPAKVVVDHVAQKHIEHIERRQARASEFDLPIDEPPLFTGQEAAQSKRQVIAPDAYLKQTAQNKKAEEDSTKEKDFAAEPELIVLEKPDLPEEKPVEQHTDYSEQIESLSKEQVLEEKLPLVVPNESEIQKPAAEEKIKKEEVRAEAENIAREIEAKQETAEYQYPPTSLLHSVTGVAADGTEEMRLNSERLNDTLQSFGIEAHIMNVTRGPSVTRYELELSRGVKLSKVTNLADDIALSLGASGVRIAAIPEKISVVGIEVPNKLVSTVFVRDVIDSPEFTKSKSKISFAVGKDIGGNRIVGDIAKLPHMLIAGTTGSGKSVCMNSLIISLLYKAKPDEVKLIMVDPKMVELGVYNGIPHLLIPVVTDPKKAAGALQWAVTEMMRRYRLMADAGVRDLESFNKLAEGSDEFEKMPQTIVVIDELADLMLVAAKEVEESICRIAQMGRAAGIHLVIATQRPSADVITGLMKANVPSRIAFAVASAMESRIILDTAGAEKLVGKGDMLYAPLGQGKPKRVQGCFITDEEVQEVVTFVKQSNAAAEYSQEVLAEIDKKAAESGKASANVTPTDGADTDDSDEMLPAAVDVLLETGQASVSMLQRRLKLGYARAARIMDEMEQRGIVGPFEGSKPRQLLITKEQWEAVKNGETVSSEPVEEEIP